MKKLIFVILLSSSWMVGYAVSGQPCLAKDSARTKEQLILELRKPANSSLLKEYYNNVENLLYNISETPLVNEKDLFNLILASDVLKKDGLQGYGNIYNGFKRSDGTIGYIEEELNDKYKYLVYRGIVYGALNCGNPIRIVRKEKPALPPPSPPKQKKEQVTEVKPADYGCDSLKSQPKPCNPCQQQSGPCIQPQSGPMYTSNYSTGNIYYDGWMYQRYQQPVVQRQNVIINAGAYFIPPPPQQRVVVVRQPYPVRVHTPPMYRGGHIIPVLPQGGGPVTPVHPTIGGGPVTPVHTRGFSGGGGPVTPRQR